MNRYVKSTHYEAEDGKSGYEIFDEIIGKIFVSISASFDDATVTFKTDEGEVYVMFHERDCCESVILQEVIGDIRWLANSPIVRAERRWNIGRNEDNDSSTWTFYEMATLEGSVTFRWYGTSNGYYSEDVCFERVGDDE